MSQLAGFDHVFTGRDCAKSLPDWILSLADRPTVTLVTGAQTIERSEMAQDLICRLALVAKLIHLRVGGEPSDEWVDAARKEVRAMGDTTCVVSIGGGSALDAGKALAALLCEKAPSIEYLEGVGFRNPSGKMLPWFALPTTAGTGSEASTNAVLSRPGSTGFKRSLRHPAYRPSGVWLDPNLTATCTPAVIASCGMDAFTQLFEAWSSTQVPADLAEVLEDALVAVYRHLPSLVEGTATDPTHAREALLIAAFLSGLGLTRAGLGTAHGLAGPIGAVVPIAHGLVCARLAGPCLRETVEWLRANPQGRHATKALGKMTRLRERLAPYSPGSTDAFADIQGWADRWELPRLGEVGLHPAHHPGVLRLASDRNSPAQLGPTVWKAILAEQKPFPGGLK
ncbi:MAG: iron-containing alcohol dehydrogenase [Opitutales bacterium]|nr:iron-containing alcohol dehydrogenase [Opitutales bacterium]